VADLGATVAPAAPFLVKGAGFVLRTEMARRRAGRRLAGRQPVSFHFARFGCIFNN